MLTTFTGFFNANFNVNTCLKSKFIIRLVFHGVLLHNFTVRS